jgi:RNA polymerase sigma factor (sigma-70 family)
MEQKHLSPEKQLMLVEKYKKGDLAAKDQLILTNMNIVYKLARTYSGRGLEFDDLVIEGVIGLLKAIEKFDISMGNRFVTYATWWVRQSMGRSIQESHKVKIPVYIIEQMTKVGTAISTLETNSLPVTPENVMEYTGLTKAQYDETMKAMNADSMSFIFRLRSFKFSIHDFIIGSFSSI